MKFEQLDIFSQPIDKDFEVGQKVKCTNGDNEGKIFIIRSVYKNNWYSCVKANDDGRFYSFPGEHLKEI